MDLDHDACYRVLQARDVRFDGRLFVGVRSTGIYCRPICPARTPLKENVEFFVSAAAAREAGYRPCLRCRPEVAPELAAWNGTSSTVARALRLIETDAPDPPAIDALADRLGIGARQLRRLFARHIGASPQAVLQTRRVHLAKQLIHDTRLPMASVAQAAGFGSVRRFNETFRGLFGRPPTALRRASSRKAGDSRDAIMLRLAYAAPYAWDETIAFLKARAISGVENVSDTSYTRSISLGGSDQGVIVLTPARKGELTLRAHVPRVDRLPAVVRRVRRLFDLGADPRVIDAHLGADRVLAPLVAARPGLRVVGAWAAFELAVRAVLGQQITVAAARGLAAALVARAGRPLDAGLRDIDSSITHAFPSPEDVVRSDLSGLGMPRRRIETLQSIARAMSNGQSLIAEHANLDDAVRALVALPGIGAWTAQYVAMRELREPDAFPASDVALLRAASNCLGRPVTPEDLLRLAEGWRPWRAYAAAHLWASLQLAPTVGLRNQKSEVRTTKDCDLNPTASFVVRTSAL
jgi:AraC family transcriptional regulator of adaptative response / DNA-3-methyladenine glycosylase II